MVEQLTLNQRVRGSSPRSPSRELCRGRAWLSGFCRRRFSGPLPRPAASHCAAVRPKYVTRRHAGFSGEAEFLAATGRTSVSPNHQSGKKAEVQGRPSRQTSGGVPFYCPVRPFAAGRRPDGWPWGGICEKGGSARRIRSSPHPNSGRIRAPERRPRFKMLRMAQESLIVSGLEGRITAGSAGVAQQGGRVKRVSEKGVNIA